MDNIGVTLRALDNRIMRYVEQRFRELDREMITGTNGWIVLYLYRNDHRDVYQRELEDEFGITRSTASKVAKLMEQKGLIERCMDGHDARQRVLKLTDTARDLARCMQEGKEELTKRLLHGFADDEKLKLTEYMERMLRNMSEEGD